MTPTGLEPAIFGLKAQCPDQLDGGVVVFAAGLEPAVFGLRIQCPSPLDGANNLDQPGLEPGVVLPRQIYSLLPYQLGD